MWLQGPRSEAMHYARLANGGSSAGGGRGAQQRAGAAGRAGGGCKARPGRVEERADVRGRGEHADRGGVERGVPLPAGEEEEELPGPHHGG